ncbi:MAG: glycosyltransferase family 39 protein [Candidatus Omnitrophica bacterium]|nr:glycosyltransferase family 39 protein [Candidatus Omnitrophota bacterium]MBU4477818.1 glycosyltransferase family 39 protein [Candidatus Omnitrophota bacterium]MCG2703546.1 glycosyltransferase family 39 protein [Candidatus Omnitrophota bacterium]
MNKRFQNYPWIIIFAAIILGYFYFLDNRPVIGVDASAYLCLARAISEGKGYTNIWLLGNSPHVKFPFLFPLLLAPLVFFFGYNFFVLKFLVVLTALLSFWGIYNLIKRLQPVFVVYVLLLTCASLHVFRYSHTILSEMPYLCFSIFFLFCALRFLEEQTCINKWGVMAGIFFLGAYFSRGIGISLLPALILTLVLTPQDKELKKQKLFFIYAILLLPVICWLLRGFLFRPDYSKGYIDAMFYNSSDPHGECVSFTAFLITFIRNLYAFIFYAVPNVLSSINFSGRNLLSFLLSVLTGWGFLKCMKKKRTIIEWYVFFYMLVLLVWPWSNIEGTRLLIPLIPFIFYYCLHGIDGFLEFKSLIKYKKILFNLFVFLLLFINISNLAGHIIAVSQEKYNNTAAKDFIKLSSWLKNNTSPEAVLLAYPSALPALYMWSERKGVLIESMDMPEKTRDILLNKEKILNIIRTNGINYIVVFNLQFNSDEMKTAVSLIADKVSIVYNNKGNIIYEVDKKKINRAIPLMRSQ